MKHKFLLTVAAALSLGTAQAANQTILNASYDIARELFAAYNPLFDKYWQEETGDKITIRQSHAGSSKQANAIIHGMPADVVTFNQVTDVNAIAEKSDLLAKDWAQRLPNNSSPYYSTMAYLVRKGNPKHITDWGDLTKDDVQIVFPNPKTSGNGRYTFLAAKGYAQEAYPNDVTAQNAFLKKLLAHVVVFDTGGRGATTSFVERGLGDVLITFESEVNNIQKQYAKDGYEVVVPKTDILAEFPVAWIDKNVAKHGTEKVAKAYVNYLYSKPAQELLASFNYRVHNPEVIAANKDKFPDVKLLTVEQIDGSWAQAMEKEFSSGGALDQLQAK